VIKVAVSFVVAAAAAVAFAPAAGPPKPIGPGVHIAGIDATGLDAEQARRRLDRMYTKPLRFRLGDATWRVSPAQLGAEPLVGDAVSRALRADDGAAIEVRVAVDKSQVRRYVAELGRRFDVPAQDARLVGLEGGRPSISDAKWGHAVRQGTMVAGITRMLRTRIRPSIPVVLRPLKPAVTRARFGPVVVIHRESKRLTLFNGSKLVRAFPIATGTAQYPTPIGTFSVVDKQRNPWWRPPDSEWAKDAKPIPPGPGNPLGTRWMGLSAPLVGIHGTPDAASIGYSASHGCIRMHIPDATWLFERVEYGTPVVIVAA
jgi:L,D-transpeptidase catalytic domain/Putative peptidoglycan binding domain